MITERVIAASLAAVAMLGVQVAPAAAADPLPPPPPPRGLLGATTAADLPVTIIGEPDVVPAAQAVRFGRVGGSVERLAGPDRYATAVEVSRHEHPGTVAHVVIASGASFADAVVAGPFAARVGGPLLLVPRAGLPVVVATELSRLAPTQVTVVGGAGVIPDATLTSIRATIPGATIVRLWGVDRYGTAAAVARRFPAGVGGVVVATGLDFPDALAAGPVAHALGGPVLLVPRASVPPAIAAEVRRLAPRRIIVAGGTSVVSAAIASRIGTLAGRTPERVAGPDRYATAARLAALLGSLVSIRGVVVATGLTYPDGLAAAASAARWPAAVLLTNLTSARGSTTAAEIGRLRGVGSWVQLTLDLAARVRALGDPRFRAYAAAYESELLAYLYGWDDPEARGRLAAIAAARKPGGGYGIDFAWDAFGDGTVNPASTRYLVTVTDHVGRVLLAAYDAGVIDGAELGSLVERVIAWPRVRGDPACLAYSDSGYDDRFCVYNVNSEAAWFLRRAWDLGIQRPGQLALSETLASHDAAIVDDEGWWPYHSGSSTIQQDWNHNAATIEQHLLLTPAVGAAALTKVIATGLWHPDPRARSWDDPVGYVRLLPWACGARSGAIAASYSVAAQQRLASDAAQLALWSARTAVACGP